MNSSGGPAPDLQFDALRLAANYRRALAREFAPFLQGRVLEVGAGVGQMTDTVRRLPGVQTLVSVEPDPAFCQQVRRDLPACALVESSIDDVPAGPWDAILSVNVLEHIQDDDAELRRYQRRLQPCRGALALFVPARRELYSPIDRAFGHHRRYNKPELRRKLTGSGFEIIRLRYFNFIAYFAWWLLYRLLARKTFNPAALLIHDRLIFPWANVLERMITPPFGQSLLAIARAI